MLTHSPTTKRLPPLLSWGGWGANIPELQKFKAQYSKIHTTRRLRCPNLHKSTQELAVFTICIRHHTPTNGGVPYPRATDAPTSKYH